MNFRAQFSRHPSLGFILVALMLLSFHLSSSRADDTPSQTPPDPAAQAPAPGTATAAATPDDGAATPEQADADYEDCKGAATDAHDACTQPQSTAGMSPQQAGQMQQYQQMAQNANSKTGQMSQQQASQAAAMCKLQADLSGALGAMSALKGNACSGTVGECTKTCDKAAKEYQSLLDNPPKGKDPDTNKWTARQTSAKHRSSSCKGLGGNASNMAQAAGSLLQGLLQNLMCDQIQATASPTPTNVGNCSDPTFAATSILCVCQNDPKNAMCAGAQQFPSGLQTTTGDLGTTAPPQGTASNGSDGQAVAQDLSKPNSMSGSATTGEGGGGGGGLQAPRPNAPNPSGEDRPAGSNVEKGVITGMMGGAGGGGGGPGGGSSAAAGSQRGGGGKGGFDLAKFLPKAPTRGIAGMSVSAKDGITGPMGPSIWEKVHNQYQRQQTNLIPEQQ